MLTIPHAQLCCLLTAGSPMSWKSDFEHSAFLHLTTCKSPYWWTSVQLNVALQLTVSASETLRRESFQATCTAVKCCTGTPAGFNEKRWWFLRPPIITNIMMVYTWGLWGGTSPVQEHFRGCEEVELIPWSGWGSVWGDIICRGCRKHRLWDRFADWRADAVTFVCWWRVTLSATGWNIMCFLCGCIIQNQKGQRVIKHSNINSAFTMLGLPWYSSRNVLYKCQLLFPPFLVPSSKEWTFSLSKCAEKNETALALSDHSETHPIRPN